MKYFLNQINSCLPIEPRFEFIRKIADSYYKCLFWSEKSVDVFIENLKAAIFSFNDKNKDVELILDTCNVWKFGQIRIYYEDEFMGADGVTLYYIYIDEVRGIYFNSKKEAAV